MTTRTDTHTERNFDPAEYEYLGYVDLFPREDEGNGADPEAVDALDNRATVTHAGGNDEWNYGQCDHCGAAFRHAMVFRHDPTGEAIAVGRDCAARFMVADRLTYELKAVDGRIESARQTAERNETFAAWVADDTSRIPLTVTLAQVEATDNFYHSLWLSLYRNYGTLTTAQEAALRKSFTKLAEWTTPGAACEVEFDEPAADVPDGRVEITGTVIKHDWYENAYGTTHKMLVKATDGGWRVFGTVPRNINVDRGTVVRFHANITPKDRDFGFFKRPTKAEVIEVAA